MKVAQSSPGPRGWQLCFPAGRATGCSPLPRTPEPACLAHPGRRQAPRSGKGFSSRPDPDLRPARPGRISHPRRGLPLSHLFTRSSENSNLPVGTELPLRGPILCPPSPVKSAHPGPTLPGPFRGAGGESGGRGGPALVSPPASSPSPPSRTPIKALSAAAADVHSLAPSPRLPLPFAVTGARPSGRGSLGARGPPWPPPWVPDPGVTRLPAPFRRPQETKPGPLNATAPRKHQTVAFLHRFNTKASPSSGPETAEPSPAPSRHPSLLLRLNQKPRACSGKGGWRCYAGPCQELISDIRCLHA